MSWNAARTPEGFPCTGPCACFIYPNTKKTDTHNPHSPPGSGGAHSVTCRGPQQRAAGLGFSAGSLGLSLSIMIAINKPDLKSKGGNITNDCHESD